jgi:hypothetical protein
MFGGFYAVIVSDFLILLHLFATSNVTCIALNGVISTAVHTQPESLSMGARDFEGTHYILILRYEYCFLGRIVLGGSKIAGTILRDPPSSQAGYPTGEILHG